MSNKCIFTSDIATDKRINTIEGGEITESRGPVTKDVSPEAIAKGDRFAEEIKERFVADFEKTDTDKMVHVSTFAEVDGVIYMTYYANCQEAKETPDNQVARFVYCPVDNTTERIIIDVQAVGDDCYGERVNMVYDTIFAKLDDNTLIILWTAKVGDRYYRLYRYFDVKTKTMGDVGVNRFKVGDVVNDFSTTGIMGALASNGIDCKFLYSDIGIMQKFTAREENGVKYYYTGAYSGDFNCIIKSRDFITWEFVAQPDFVNQSKYENATYVIGDKVYYFVRQHDHVPYGFLTTFDLNERKWEIPVLVDDCQSRSDFIVYRGELYLFHAPINREHIGIIRINTKDIAKSKVVLQADMKGSCFYPFIQYLADGELAMSYTVSREHIRLARFDLSKYI